MSPPAWGLTVAYWLHLLATVVWIGSLAALSILVLPAASRALDRAAFANLLSIIQKRLDPLGWFCLAVLVGTGMFQMSASPNYEGFLRIDSTWGVAILAKHILFAGMTALSAYLTWGLLPALRRETFRQARDSQEVAQLERRNLILLRLNLILSILILALTALARVS
jgi:uncharacterized membrane protein